MFQTLYHHYSPPLMTFYDRGQRVQGGCRGEGEEGALCEACKACIPARPTEANGTNVLTAIGWSKCTQNCPQCRRGQPWATRLGGFEWLRQVLFIGLGHSDKVIFFFLVIFISTCLVTVTPQCILFSEMVKKDSYIKLEISDTALWCPRE